MAKDSSFDVVSQVDMQESVTISAAAMPALSWKKNALNLPPKTSTN